MTLSKTIAMLLLCISANAIADSAAEKFWPQWRGPFGTGVGPHADPPLNWSETNNIKWKLALPGEGDSTPIVWADRVFVLSAIPSGKGNTEVANGKSSDQSFRFAVISVDRATGKILWQKVAREAAPHEGRQE